MWGICRPTLCFVLCRRLLSFHTCASHELVFCFSVARFAVCASGRASGKTSSPCFVLLTAAAEPYCRRGLLQSSTSGIYLHVGNMPTNLGFVLCRRLLSFQTGASRNSACFSVARFAVCASGRASGKTSSPCFVLLSTARGAVLSEGSAAEQHVRHLPACGEYTDQPCVSSSADASSLSRLAPLTNSACFSVGGLLCARLGERAERPPRLASSS